MSIDELISETKYFARCKLPASMDAERTTQQFEFQQNGLFLNDTGDVFTTVPFAPFSKKSPQRETSQHEHASAIEAALQAIDGGTLQKVVLSCIKHAAREVASLDELFLRMASRYENAFVYIINHPQYGIWMGATPELLLEKKEDTWHTVSLAGTQAFQSEKTITWSDKLTREQQLVTSYITVQLAELGASEIMVQGPYTAQAGPLFHLKTDIAFTSQLNSSAIIEKLQPTPAVCGLPRDTALAFITEHSDFERRLYAGRLGIVKANGNETHFVNLRCMQVFDDHFELHVGGGIVAGSTPEDEWRETEMKADVLRSILH